MADFQYLCVSIAVMAVVTYLIRMLPLAAFRKKIKSKFALNFLYYVPYAVLSAMTIPAIFYSRLGNKRRCGLRGGNSAGAFGKGIAYCGGLRVRWCVCYGAYNAVDWCFVRSIIIIFCADDKLVIAI